VLQKWVGTWKLPTKIPDAVSVSTNVKPVAKSPLAPTKLASVGVPVATHPSLSVFTHVRSSYVISKTNPVASVSPAPTTSPIVVEDFVVYISIS